MTTERRAYLAEPGRTLVLPMTTDLRRLALETQIDQLQQWLTDTGMDTASVYSTPLVATPLPLYGTRDERDRSWDGLNPGMLWHPLLWLPTRLRTPYLLREEGQEDRLETLDEWAVRVALEMTASRMYDPALGAWCDVLALHDIDITAPGTLTRLQAWLEGGSDPGLDAVTLEPWFPMDAEEPHWAAELVHAIFPDLVQASWATVAGDLLAMLVPQEDPSAEDLQRIISVAISLIGPAPLDETTTLEDRLGRLGESVGASTPPGQVRSTQEETATLLTTVASAYLPSVTAVTELAGATLE